VIDLFRPSYAAARQTWLALAAARGLQVETHLHPLPGPHGEPLAIDVVRDGPADADAVLLTTSAVHGVEGHGGCGIQAGLLQVGESLRALAGPRTALLHVHAVNPHGFAHGRRVNEDNVDLNRNFIDFGQALSDHPDYAAVHTLLLPAAWPPSADNEAALQAALDAMGPRRAQMAITRGQHSHPQGLYFGGHRPAWSNTVFRSILRRHAAPVRRVAWIDLHSGLGPFGVGERIYASFDTGPALARARRWWGDGVTSVDTGSSTSIPMTGPIQAALADEAPAAEYTGICLEFGTVPLPQMINALRADHWLHARPQADAALAARIRHELRAAFFPDTDAWKQALWTQGLQAAQQALVGLRDGAGLPPISVPQEQS
jgi:hypothetical protein